MRNYEGPIGKISNCRPGLDPAYYRLTPAAKEAMFFACVEAAQAAGCDCAPEPTFVFSYSLYCYWTPPPENFPGGNVSIYTETVKCNMKNCKCPTEVEAPPFPE